MYCTLATTFTIHYQITRMPRNRAREYMLKGCAIRKWCTFKKSRRGISDDAVSSSGSLLARSMTFIRPPFSVAPLNRASMSSFPSPKAPSTFAKRLFVHDSGQTTARLAKLSDVERVTKFYQEHGTEHLHVRTSSYISSRIERKAILVEEGNDDDSIQACMEVLLLSSKNEINNFCLEHDMPVFTIPHQENDVLFNFAGGLKSKKGGCRKHITERALKIFAEVYNVSAWTESHSKWENGASSSSSPPRRPGRVFFAMGTSERNNMIPFFRQQVQKNFWPGTPISHSFAMKCSSPANDMRGNMHFLVHDPPLTPHQKERTKRNRYLITEIEQRRLLGTRIGFIGLSTGSVALEVFLREGIGGIYRIADFDLFETSNSNRMLFGASSVGRSKVDLCIERIKSVDPCIQVEPFPEGLSEENVSDFVQDCDIIVEECDDFAMKLMVREVAKKYRRPVLMATSQNGMIDVERYDTDPSQQPFHVEDQTVLEAFKSPDLSAEEMAGLLTRIFDFNLLHPRFVASSSEIGKSISSWPQLAEEVFLNASILTHAARRILLGDESVVSGRFSVRMDRLFSSQNRISTETPPASISKEEDQRGHG